MNSQKGIGLVEVLVALLLLAIAVLGFSAMQMTAVKATDESLMRTRALTVLRGAAEMMRANIDGIPAFKTAINGTATTLTNTDTSNVAITKDSCMTGGTPVSCTIKQLAVKDALTVKQYATDNELNVSIVTCPGTGTTTTTVASVTTTLSGQERQCFVASWGTTNATLGTDTNDCADANGVYKVGAQCFIMEAY
ncbi:type IV pilus modification protein PilV [bacterium M00.F.Ca.ET.230.01.1.1]|nr:type IV pilus modification protein PilV [bacterium M00.F.Ca.ET.230.01.1.1]